MLAGRIIRGYLFSKANRNRQRSLRIFLGLMLSAFVLLSVISVMDYLQTTRFKYIKMVRSFPLTVEAGSEEEALSLVAAYSDLNPFIYRTGAGLIQLGGESIGVDIRYIDDSYNGGLSMRGDVSDGLLISYATYLDKDISSSILELTRLEKGKRVNMAPKLLNVPLAGFYSSYLGREFDERTVFMDFDMAASNDPYIVAFPVSDDMLMPLSAELEESGYDAKLWMESESSLYGAMLLEKIVMQVLLSSLFVIVFFQILQNSSMLASSKQRELVALHLMGVSRREIGGIAFMLGFFLSCSGIAAGALFSICFLKVLPFISTAFRGAVFKADFGSIAFISLFFILISALCYVRAFLRSLKEEAQMEVLNIA